ncbi:hypothetical protein AJ80_07695 [Polytolypa hystricis UAMH7299]|uniref:Uncharacterized protein n=1 Tax=Polytolypa hystricis (strain UAMH7299) TaxID=1447883 RepID=A0A2B7XKG7_POLH7|nr:hypothetical protein AJ80_07695 [Polytolypa hystricis UAMH7299]
MHLDELERCSDRERALGNHVPGCVAYAGDSRSMRIDNLGAIGQRLRSSNIWSHVDACHGSMLAFSRKHRHKISETFQQKITQRDDLLLLNKTDIISCVFLFMPQKCQNSRISVADMEKLNACNKCIKTTIAEKREVYARGFMLKKLTHFLIPEDTAVYVLRTMDGSPLSQATHRRYCIPRTSVLHYPRIPYH